MSKHTPGPWVAGDCGAVFNGAGNKVAGCGVSHFLTTAEMDANARLIAAAPQMLSVLQEALEFFEDRSEGEYFPDRAAPVGNAESRLASAIRDVLSKAEAPQ